MQANLNRLQRPDQRAAPPAQAAGSAGGGGPAGERSIQADLRDARLRLLAEDLSTLRTALDAEVADETALLERRAQVEADLAEADAP